MTNWLSNPSYWRRLLAPDDLVIAGVSGGADSICMALMLKEEASRRGWRLQLAHVHHHLRGGEADRDAQFVKEFAERIGIPCALMDVDPSLFERIAGESLEAKLREARMDLLRALAAGLGARALALAHHADDLAETFLLMALRGSGPSGLGSLRPLRELEDGLLLVRPLLDRSRNEIEEELRARGESWRTDSSNADPKFRRNRLRHEVMPLLRELEPGAAGALARAAALCAEESQAIDELAAELESGAVVSRRENSALLRLAALESRPAALRAAAVRRVWRSLSENGLPPDFATVQELLQRVRSGDGSALETPQRHGVCAWTSSGWLMLARIQEDAQNEWTFHFQALAQMMILPDEKTRLTVLNSSQRATPGEYEIPMPAGCGRLSVRVLESKDYVMDPKAEAFVSHRSAAFDARSIMRDLHLRALAPEDSIGIGNKQTKTGEAVLQEARVPADIRGRVACLCDDRGVLWVPGLRRAVSAYVSERTPVVLLMEWEQTSANVRA